MRVSIARCALVAVTMLGLCGCSSSGGAGGFAWNPFSSKSKDVAATPPKPSAFSTPTSTASSEPEQIASKTGTSSPDVSLPGAPAAYSSTLDALTKVKSSSEMDASKTAGSYTMPQNGYYEPSSYTASTAGPGSRDSSTSSGSYAGSSLPSQKVPSYSSTASTAGWGASVSNDAPRYAPAAERYGNPVSYAAPAGGSLAGSSASGYTGSSPTYPATSGSPYAYTASSNSSFGNSAAFPTTSSSTPGYPLAGDSRSLSNSYGSTAGSGLPPYVSGQSSTSYQPAQTDYQPGNTSYTPAANRYTPGSSGYNPGSNGYTPAGTEPYQSPAGSYQTPAVSYQSPAASYQSPAASYETPGGAYQSPLGSYSSQSTTGNAMPEYRPGSTKSLPSYGGSTTVADSRVTPAGYGPAPTTNLQ